MREVIMLIETIKSDINTARKNKHSGVLQVLITFYSEASMVGKNDGNRLSTNAEVIAVGKKFIKNINTTLDVCDKKEVIDSLKYEAELIESYLPKQLSEQELTNVITNTIANNGYSTMKDMGKVMAKLKDEYSGTYDGKLASTLCRKLL